MSSIIVLTVMSVVSQELEVRAYDVRKLTEEIPDRAGVDIDLEWASGAPPALPEVSGLTEDGVADLIMSFIDPDRWDAGGGRISAQDGLLLVTAPRQIHDRISALLAYLETLRPARIRVEGILVEMGTSDARSWREGTGEDAAAVLTEAQATWLVNALRSGAAELRGALEVGLVDGRRNHAVSRDQASYVRSWTSNVAGEVALPDPDVGLRTEGFMLDVEGRLDAVAGEVQALVHASWVGEEPAGSADVGDGRTVTLPRSRMFRYRSSMVLPLGRLVAAAILGTEERSMALLIRATAQAGAAGTPPAAAGEMQWRAFDVSRWAFRGTDFPAVSLQVPSEWAWEGGMRFQYEDVDSPWRYPGEVEEVIRDHVSPETWEETPGAGTYLLGNWVLAQNRAEVLDRVERFLEAVGGIRPRTATTDCLQVRLTGEAAWSWLAAPPGPELGRDEVQAWERRGEVVSWGEISGLEGKTSNAMGVSRAAYVADYSAVMAYGAGDLDPEEGILTGGLILGARPMRGSHRNRVWLTFENLDCPSPAPLQLPTGGRVLNLPGAALRSAGGHVEGAPGTFRVVTAQGAGDEVLVTLVRVR